MTKTTDIEQVRMVAKSFLDLDIHEDMIHFDGFILTHPFYGCSKVYLPADGEFVDILASEEGLKRANELYCREIEESDVKRLFSIMQKAYQRTFFKHVNAFLSDKDYAEIWRTVWRNTEFPSQDKNLSVAQMMKIFKKSKKVLLMSEAEQKALAELPDEITVYRGVDDTAYAYKNALSWTLDCETAKFFSDRFSKGTGVIMTARVNKKDVLAYFGDCSEEEIIVDYNRLIDITEYVEGGY